MSKGSARRPTQTSKREQEIRDKLFWQGSTLTEMEKQELREELQRLKSENKNVPLNDRTQ